MPSPNHKIRHENGFSLPEVVLALSILGTVLVAFTGAILISQKVANQNLLRTSAYLAAQSYLDQVRGMPAATLNKSIDNPNKYPLPTVGVSVESGNEPNGSDPLYLNKANSKTLLVDTEAKRGGKSYERTLNMLLTPIIRDQSPTMEAYEIRIDFSYETQYRRTTKQIYGSVRFLKAKSE